jgi:uncharacterized membrane protein YfcA
LGVPADLLIAGSVGLTASVSAYYGANYGKSQDSSKLTFYFGVLACFISIFVLSFNYYKKRMNHSERKTSENIYFYSLIAGTICGFLSGLLGIGGGKLYFYKSCVLCSFFIDNNIFTISSSNGNSNCMLCSSIDKVFIYLKFKSGVRTHYKLGNLKLNNLIFISLGTAFGGIVGSNVGIIFI